MATGYAKATGRPGVCLATSGPGGIHLLNGLYDAKLDHMPVLAITGMQETSVLGTGYQQEVDLTQLYQDVAEYNQMICNPAQIATVVDTAVRTACARRAGARHARPELLAVAEHLGAPIVKTLSGKATVPDDSPYTTGGIGLLGANGGSRWPGSRTGNGIRSRRSTWSACWASLPPGTRSSPATAARSRPGPHGTGRSGTTGSSSCPGTWPPWRRACRMPSACSTRSPAASIATTLFKDKIEQLKS